MSKFKKALDRASLGVKRIMKEELTESEALSIAGIGLAALLIGFSFGSGLLTVLGLLAFVSGGACWLEQRDVS